MWFNTIAFYQQGARIHKSRNFSAHALNTITGDLSLVRPMEAADRVS